MHTNVTKKELTQNDGHTKQYNSVNIKYLFENTNTNR